MSWLQRFAYTLCRRWRRFAIEAIIIIGIVGAIQVWNARGAVQGEAPVFTGPGLDGRPMVFPERGEQPTIIHFWATWCHICPWMDGSVNALVNDHEVVTVALSSGGADAVMAHMRERDLSFPVVLDESGHIANGWGVRGVPTTFFIDATGHIRNVTVGYTSWLGLHMRLWWAGRS